MPDGFFEHSKVTALTLVGLDPRQAASVCTYRMQEGRFLRSDDDLAAVITTSLAESLRVKLGDELHLPTTEGVVTLGIVGLQPARTLPGNEFYASIQLGQAVFSLFGFLALIMGRLYHL